MPEVTALRKHPCPECGGDAEWNAAKQALVCPYCGTSVPWSQGENAPGATILEHDLAAALGKVGDAGRGWREARQAVQCQSCHAISVFEPGRAAQRCDFCGSPSIVPHEALKDVITPESVLPARLDPSTVRDLLRKWYGSRWFAPDKLKSSALTDTLHGIYLPYWTFDCQVHAEWTAESGYHYWESETYRDANGRTATRQVRKTRWEPSAGGLDHFFDDLLVPGSVGVRLDLLRQTEPFPTEELKPYDPAYVRGWTVERYQIDLHQAAEHNRADTDARVRQLCAAQVPGDTHRNLEVDAAYSERTFKHILVPVWLVSYTYGAKAFQVVLNGYTGRIAGEHPLSWVKITLAAAAVLVLLLIVALVLGRA